jgi:Cys-rich repeat protein
MRRLSKRSRGVARKIPPQWWVRFAEALRWTVIVYALGCGKERPFADGAAPLQPVQSATDPDGGAAVGRSGSKDCDSEGCDPPLTCDAQSGRCVECLTTSDCTGANAPICDTGRQVCVRCLSDVDCPIATPACRLTNDAAANLCVQCLTDAQCAAETPACDLNANACTARCNDSAQCGPAAPVCDIRRQVCVQCQKDADCSSGSVCEVASARCVQCLDDRSCTGGQICDLATRTCVECLDTAQCLDEFNAHCQTDPSLPEPLNTCAGCADNRDCANKPGLGGLCRVSDGKCVECLSDAECSSNPNAWTCSQVGTCSPCSFDPNACLPTGGCVECVSNAQCGDDAGASVCKLSTEGEAAGPLRRTRA